MARKCTICVHPERYSIELALLHRVPMRVIASRFRVSEDAVWRHSKHGHIAKGMREAKDRQDQRVIERAVAYVFDISEDEAWKKIVLLFSDDITCRIEEKIQVKALHNAEK